MSNRIRSNGADTPSSETSDRVVVPSCNGTLQKRVLTITVAAFLLIVWQLGARFFHDRHLAEAAVQSFHQRLNSAQYREIFSDADAGFTEGKTEEDLLKFLQTIHSRFGDAGNSDFSGISVNVRANGTFTTVQCKTTFAQGSALETFTWIRAGKMLRLYGYDIRSKASLTR